MRPTGTTFKPLRRAPRRILARHDRHLEALRMRLAQPLVAVGHRAHLPGEADLPERDQRCGHHAVGQARGECDQHRHVPGGLADLDAAHHVHEHVVLLQRDTGVAVGRGQQHRQAVGIQSLRDAPRRPEAHAIHQCLQLDQQRPPALARHGDDAAGGRLGGARQEDRRRVLHFLQARAGHGEEAQLVHRAEAVLGGAHDAVAAAGLALEIQHGVDQVLEQARAGDRPVLGDVADDDHRAAGGLRVAHQFCGALAQLGHGPGTCAGNT